MTGSFHFDRQAVNRLLAVAVVVTLLLAAQARARRGAAADEAPSPHAQARVEAARKGYDQALATWRLRSGGSPGALYWWSLHSLAAQRALSPAAADQVTAFQAHRDRMRALAQTQHAATAAGLVPNAETVSLDYYRAEADAWYADAARGKLPPPMP